MGDYGLTRTHRGTVRWVLAAAIGYTCLSAGAVGAETSKASTARPAAKRPAAGRRTSPQDQQPEEKPKSSEYVDTPDGVRVKFDYYASRLGKEAAPVILIHDWGRSREDFGNLPQQLQKAGFAVLALDLRGHGASVNLNEVKWRNVHRDRKAPVVQRKRRRPRRRKESDDDATVRFEMLDRSLFMRGDFLDMRTDVEWVKWFATNLNNKLEANVRKLALLGVGMGANVAIRYGDRDWSFDDWRGQEVHGLALVSPNWQFRGITIKKAFSRLLSPRADKRYWPHLYIMAGTRDRKNFPDAQRLARLAKRASPTFNQFGEFKTDLAGHALLGMRADSLERRELLKWMVQYVQNRNFSHEQRNLPPDIKATFD